MDKEHVIFILVVTLILVAFIYSYGLKGTTTAIVYGKCWESKRLAPESVGILSTARCSIENDICTKDASFCTQPDTYARVCCPAKECPDISEVYC